MIDPSPGADRRAFRIMGIVIAVVVIATLAATGAVLLARARGVNLTLPARGTPAASTAALSLRRAIELRVAPAPDTEIVTRLSAGRSVHVLGRSVDSTWIVVGLDGAPDVVGWVPLDAIEGLRDVNRFVVVADARSVAATPLSGSARPPDLPDLRIEAASSKNNRIVAVIVNDGPSDLPTPLLVSVNEGPPIRIETKAGEPLRARERVEAIVPGEYVQLRARLSLRVQTEPASRETNVTNNTWTGIIEPDRPNNLGIARAVADGADRHLLVTIQNDSPIPIRGTVMLTVREPLPSTTLLGRDAREVALEAGKSLDIPFPEIKQVDLTRIAVRLSTDAIHDDVLADDSYPR